MANELKLKEGDKAPEFTAETNGGGKVSLSDFRGKNVVVICRFPYNQFLSID
jgi:peroxiredoxin